MNVISDEVPVTDATVGDSTNPSEVTSKDAKPPKETLEERRARLWVECKKIATCKDILAKFLDDLSTHGLSGEAWAAALMFIALCSQWGRHLISIILKGPSSGGKSFTIKNVLKFVPKDRYHELTAMTDKALAYSKVDLRHKHLVMYEAAGMKAQTASYLIRSLLSEGCINYEVTDWDKKNTMIIHKPGPTGLITSTTAAIVHPENETRMFSVDINDSKEQTHAIIMAAAGFGKKRPVNLRPWHSFHEWLSISDKRVVVPFTEELAKLVSPVATRLRRDFPAFLAVIETHAFIHQSSRQKDGKTVATLEDYAAAKALVGDLISQGAGATVSKYVRETVEAVRVLASEGGVISMGKLAKELKLHKSTVSRRVEVAVEDGYLWNREKREGMEARLELGDPLPSDQEVLPSVEKLEEVLGL